ncbi:TylF/MycF/NovP-related O-methyltransferase [Spirochaetota bacterium]
MLQLLRKIKNALFINLAPLFKNSSFFLQGQMDIHKKSAWYNKDLAGESGGFFLKGDPVQREIAHTAPWDLVRRDMLILLLRSILERKIEGEMAELGVFKGLTAKLIHYYMPDRQLHLFDTFEGFDKKDKEANDVAKDYFTDTSMKKVLRYIKPKNNNINIYPGRFPTSIPDTLQHTQFAFVHLDADLYEPITAGLDFFYERTPKGGFIVVHDYNAWPGARRGADEFFKDKKEFPVPMPDKSGSALIIKE